MDIRRVLDLAAEGSIVGELDFSNDDGGVAAHDVTSPQCTLPETALCRRVGSIVEVEDLQKNVIGGFGRKDHGL